MQEVEGMGDNCYCDFPTDNFTTWFYRIVVYILSMVVCRPQSPGHAQRIPSNQHLLLAELC